jgi:dienelactone hydrolase
LAIDTRGGPPVSVHIARPDPFDDGQFFEDWEKEAATAALDIHRYDHAGHYFLDNSLPDYDADAAQLCIKRCLAFLGAL